MRPGIAIFFFSFSVAFANDKVNHEQPKVKKPAQVIISIREPLSIPALESYRVALERIAKDRYPTARARVEFPGNGTQRIVIEYP